MSQAVKHATFTLPVKLIEDLNGIEWINKSQFVSEALKEKLKKIRIMKAITWLEKLRNRHGDMSEDEIVELVRKDRMSH